MENLIQAELDIVEEHILTCLFGDATNPQINGAIKSYFTIIGQNPIHIINDNLKKFETIVKPYMNPNGKVSGEKISALLEARFNKQIPIGDFRMVEVTRMIEPWLKTLGTFLQ